MNQMTHSPSKDRLPDPEWPVGAVPEPWINALFDKMTAFYGSRFADLWGGSDLVTVRRAWGVELAKLSRAELKAGVDKLVERRVSPTLPEFFALCKQSRPPIDPSHVLAPPGAPRGPVDMTKVDATVRKASEALAAKRPHGVEWAFKMLAQGKTNSGLSLPIGVVDAYKRAILSPAGSAFMRTTESAAYRELYQRVQGEAGVTA